EHSAPSLIDLISEGLKEQVETETEHLLVTLDPMEVINGYIIPALSKVGEDYESGESFLPQLLMSAEAAGIAFEVIKKKFKGGERKNKGTILLATVKGDIHDIGKNIVKVLLENYDYRVIDLGKDVDPELILETVLKEQVKFIGLSALMTTTVPFMAKTIELLKDVDCKTLVGGAVLTQEYADKIGADYYAKDAMATVRFAEEFFGQPNIR
ncbi:MAG: cobalamin-dependent protein, partial [Anaerovoracaceae bacterium]